MYRFGLVASLLFVTGCEASTPLQLAMDECSGQEFRALEDVCVLAHDALEGRLIGTEGNAAARDYIISRYEEIGVEPVSGSYVHAFDFERRVDRRDIDSPTNSFVGYNVIGVIPGRDRSKALAITAHYDHIGPGENQEIFNGADDNASGVGAILAVAEHFSQNPPAHDVLVIAFDAEEGGLDGARAFVESPPDGSTPVAINFNLDMVGYSPEGDIWVSGSYHTPSLLPLIEAANTNSDIEVLAGFDQPTDNPRNDWTLLSDHAPFHVAGLPFLYMGVEDHEHYHQASDDFSIIEPGFYAGVVDVSIQLAVGMDQWLVDAQADSNDG